jgi:four helix bundle protein
MRIENPKNGRISECGLRIENPKNGRISECGMRIEKKEKNWQPHRSICRMFLKNGYAMNAEDLKKRTKFFSIGIMKLAEELPVSATARMIQGQLLRCGTSVGANYRASCRAKSPADFIAKMGIVEEETDEVLYWMELLVEMGLLSSQKIDYLTKEANEILAITVASIRTARKSKSGAGLKNPQSAIRNPQ